MTSEQLSLASADSVVLTSSFLNKEQRTSSRTPSHIAAEMCEMTKTDSKQKLNVMENPCHQGQGSPLLPFQWIQISV
jgi:hypothetical protein